MSSTEPFVDHCGDLERGVPNLDAMDMSHLYKFIAATRGIRPYRAARRMFGEVPAYATVVALHNYARNKVTAMKRSTIPFQNTQGGRMKWNDPYDWYRLCYWSAPVIATLCVVYVILLMLVTCLEAGI
jgi:hypothetical protein